MPYRRTCHYLEVHSLSKIRAQALESLIWNVRVIQKLVRARQSHR